MVGVDASPSCGVFKSLDMRDALERTARLDQSTATAREPNRVVLETVVHERGLFTELLEEELEKRRLRIPWKAHDLIAELQGGA